jgi:hypothetical protein
MRLRAGADTVVVVVVVVVVVGVVVRGATERFGLFWMGWIVVVATVAVVVVVVGVGVMIMVLSGDPGVTVFALSSQVSSEAGIASP